MVNNPVIVWFSRDLRLSDHPALHAAVAGGAPVIPVYVLDEESAGRWRIGGASRWWLANSIRSLAGDLASLGSRLILRRGNSAEALARLAEQTGAVAVYWTRPYEPHARVMETQVRAALQKLGITSKRFCGRLLFQPEAVTTGQGTPYKVFAAFYKACLAGDPPGSPLPAPQELRCPENWPESEALSDWQLEPNAPDWAGGLRETWMPGETGARTRLRSFLDEGAGNYDKLRNRPDLCGTSRLSPHLAFGEISPREVWHALQAKAECDGHTARGVASFLRELVWREFCYHQLFHWPDLPDEPWQSEFKRFPWNAGKKALRRWQRGQTGFPIVDAGMRQLWHTGWMHNRVRMITASFLVKDLMISWREGEAWFWDTLVDADLANNSAGWQWVAGSGPGAAPYFRVFNPVLQAARFDPEGAYVRRWVPELAKLPDRHIHAPWQAPARVLEAAGVKLGQDYPTPIVDHAVACRRALQAYRETREAGNG